MRPYLDTSALAKLYVDEEGSPYVRQAVDDAELVATSANACLEEAFHLDSRSAPA